MATHDHPPVDWESRYQATDTPWDKGAPHPVLEAGIDPPARPGAVLVPGCGTGWDLPALARLLPDRGILGVDIAATAVAAASRRCAGIPNITVRQADIFAPDFATAAGPIALLWEHTCFCAIPPALRPAYAAMAARLVIPGGAIHGVFFLTLDDAGGGPPWNCPEPELRALFGPWFEIPVIHPAVSTYPGRDHSEWQVQMIRTNAPAPTSRPPCSHP